jgi:TPP-dependent pyruvate/acetoin dehydrogenase alpha subunit
VAVAAEVAAILELYREMVRIRRFEERVYTLFLDGEIPGTLHQYQGQEAVAVGVCAALARTDWITSTHRPHGHALAKGVSARAAMAELYGKATGCCRGRGGSMHLGDPDVGMLPAIAIVGGGNTVVTGLGLAFAIRRTSQVAVCFFGEGATNEGAFHEGLNFAAVRALPVVFVCENNLYGEYSPIATTTSTTQLVRRGESYSMAAVAVDGNDVLAVLEVAEAAVVRARAGEGPTFVEALTYRQQGHSRSDPGAYREPGELERWLERDPITLYEHVLRAQDPAWERECADIRAAVEAAVAAASERALAWPEPAAERLTEYVFA